MIGVPLAGVVGAANAYGTELVLNGDGGSAVGWVAARGGEAISAVGGRIRITSVGSTCGVQQVLSPLVIGKSYRVRITGYRTSGTVLLRFQNTSGLINADSLATISSGSATVDQVVSATAETMYIGAIVSGAASGQYSEIDDISVMEVL